MIAQIKEYHSVSAVHPPLGIQLRVGAASLMGRCTMSAATAAIGRLLLAMTTLTTCSSTTMATSVRRAAAVARAVFLSVVSKNQNNLISGSLELRLRICCKIVTYAKSPAPSGAGDFVQYAE